MSRVQHQPHANVSRHGGQRLRAWHLRKSPKQTHTAEPGSPTIFAPISFSAWNSAHHRPRKVTPKSFPIVNAARIYHFDNMTSIGMWFPHCERKSHHSKKHVFGGLNWGTVKCFSHCQRHVKSNPIASIAIMIFYMWNVLFPLSTPC